MTVKETDDERIKRLVTESVAEQKRQERAGVPGAHLSWALAAAVLDTLNAGYRITDLACFQLSPLYTGPLRSPWRDGTGGRPRAGELSPEINTEPPAQDTITQNLIAEELKNITVPSPDKISGHPEKVLKARSKKQLPKN